MPVNQHLLSQSAELLIEKAKGGGGGHIFWGGFNQRGVRKYSPCASMHQVCGGSAGLLYIYSGLDAQGWMSLSLSLSL